MNSTNFRKHMLGAGSALRVLAMVGAGVAASTVAITPAAAQDYTSGAITGTVTDDTGAAVSGATVTVVSQSQGFTRTSTTSSNGNFRFGSLPTGDYDIEVSNGGTVGYRAEAVPVLAGQSNSINIELASTGGDVITVIGTQIANDFEGTTQGLNVDLEELVKTVPISRDLTSVVLLAPGTTQGDSAFGNLASIGGSSVAENAYYVNGLNLTNFDNYLGSARVPFEMLRSVEAKTGGYPAEFGRATGGVVNSVTKSGSNDWSGAVHLNWEPDFLQSYGEDQFRNGLGSNITNRAAETSDSYSAIVELGGPIIKDRLFVYGLVEFREDKFTTVNRANNTVTETVADDPFWGVKVDAYPLDNHHFEFTIFDTERTSNVSEGSYLETANGVQIGQFSPIRDANFGGLSYVGKYTGTLTDWLTVSAAYGKMKDRFDTTVLGSNDPLARNFSGGDVGGVSDGGNYGDQRSATLTSPYATEREFYRADADLYFTALGEHHIRFGFDTEINTLARTTVNTGGDFLLGNGQISQAAYDFGTGGAGYQFIIFPGNTAAGPGTVVDLIYFNSGGQFESKNKAFYIQDEWNVTDRLTLNLGLRRDDFAVDKADGSPFLRLDENYAPRLGFEYKLFDDQSARIYGFFGQYFLPVASNTAFRGAGAEVFFRERYTFDGFDANGLPATTGAQITSAEDSRYGLACPFALSPNGAGGNTCRVTGDGTVPGSSQFFASDLKATKQSEYIIGYEQDLGDWTVGLSYIRRVLDRTAEDASIDFAAGNYCVAEGFSRADCDDIWNGFHQYVTFNVGSGMTVDLLGGGSPGNPADALDGRTVTFSAEDLGLPEVTRTYDAVEFTFDRKWDGNWSLGGSYTWSESKGNTEGYVQSDFGQDDAGITQDFDVIGFTDFANGLLPNHRRHRMKLFGAVALGDKITIGGNASLASPRPLSCFGFHPTDITGNLYGAASRYCGLQPFQRGTGFRTDWESRFDLSGRYNIETETGQTITFRADVFNIFNSQAITQRIETGDLDIAGQNAAGEPTAVTADPDYGLASGFQAARSVRLGIDISF
ncbi:TonB-dependent receptor [Altererythrobacter sp. ZODW24]|uniref:TonB-dependent receptor n=1 Tax=Altererythrobacter sp. ZODW24 TaxID=2185142 RepID=UPI000DF81885|nr:TonB-dependent receptor [Altererythrobacter sp. ZODW24]